MKEVSYRLKGVVKNIEDHFIILETKEEYKLTRLYNEYSKLIHNTNFSKVYCEKVVTTVEVFDPNA